MKILRLNIFARIALILSLLAVAPLVISSILIILTYQDLIAKYFTASPLLRSDGSDLFLTLNNVKIRVGLVVFMAAALSVFSSLLLGRSFSSRLRALFAGTQAISKGDLNVRINIDSRDEIGELASSFNEMAAALSEARGKLEEYGKGLEEKIAERTKEVNEARDFSENVIHTMLDGLFVTDLGGDLIKINKGMADLTGYSEEEVFGKNILKGQFYSETESSKVAEVFKRALREDYVRNIEIILLSKDGRQVPVRIGASVLRNRDGRPKAMVAVVHDISQEKEVERMKSELLSNISHELRTPLTAIQGFTNTLLTVNEIDEQTRLEFLKIVEEESERLGRSISDLLDISKMEAGWVKITKERHQLLDIVRDVVDEFSTEAKAKEILLRVSMPEELQEVEIDKEHISQAMGQLLSNAIKFTNPAGRITLEVADSGGQVAVSVSDTGVGIPKDALPMVFDRFFKVRRPGVESKGVGVGLALVKYIVENHGGRVWAESEEGKGSKFTFTLPKAG